MDFTEQLHAVEACKELMESLDAFLREQRSWSVPVWHDLRFPCIDRGVHAILPLLAVRMTGDGSSTSERDLAEINERLWWHWGYWYGGHSFRVGSFRDSDEWGRKVLGDKMLAAGAQGRGPTWWDIAGHVVIFVTSAAPGGTLLSSALHVVPRDWIFAGQFTPSTKRELSHCRTVLRTVAAANVEWAWGEDQVHSGDIWVTSRTSEGVV